MNEVDNLNNPWASKYNDSMCEQVIDMFSRGKTLAHFCSANGIGRDTYCKWRKRHKRFDNACILGEQKAREYYDAMREQYMIEDPQGAKMNWNAFNKMYSARFNIADKRTVRVKGLGKSKDEREMLICLTKATEAQELTPDEVSKLLGIIDTSLRVKQTLELEDRLKLLESSQGLEKK